MLRMILACAVLSACSFTFVKDVDEPARTDRRMPISCTTSRALPVTDLVIGAALGGFVAVATYMAIESANDEGCPNCLSSTKPALLATFLVVSPWWISSAVGFSDTSRCRAVLRDRRDHGAPAASDE
jgi:hypothetical protein